MVSIYEILDSPPEFVLAGRVASYERLDQVLQAIMSSQFDPRTTAVVPGPPRQVEGPQGEVDVLFNSPDRIELETRSPEGGVLIVQRVFLALYRATIDGEPAPTTVANLHRLGLEVPAGEHRVEIWVEAGPFWRSLWGSAVGAAGLAALPWLLGRRRRRMGAAPVNAAAEREEPGDAAPGVTAPAEAAPAEAAPAEAAPSEEYTRPIPASARASDADSRDASAAPPDAEVAEAD
jgi:hypothetical protein